MTIKVGINGFGRIGRTFTRSIMNLKDIEVVAVNDPYMDAPQMEYLFKYDTTYGTYSGTVSSSINNVLLIDDKRISTFKCWEPEDIPWATVGVEYVIECSGQFKTMSQVNGHLGNGVKKVVLTCPSPDVPTFVMGVNHKAYTDDLNIVSCTAATTNAAAVLITALRSKFELEEGLITAVLGISGKMSTVDNVKSGRQGRAANASVNPDAKPPAILALKQVLPDMADKFTGMIMRVPTQNIGVIDLTFRTKEATTYPDVIEAMRNVAKDSSFSRFFGVTDDQLVSSDIIGKPTTVLLDAKGGLAVNDHFFKVIGWYDNEFGYCQRLIDLVQYISTQKRQHVKA